MMVADISGNLRTIRPWLSSTIYLERKDDCYRGKMKEGQGCRLSSDSTSFVQIEFELTDTAFITLDRAFDPITHAQVWGSKGGPYHYLKQVSG
jgi:CpeT protein